MATCLCSCQAQRKLTPRFARCKLFQTPATLMCAACMDPCRRKSKTPRLIPPSEDALLCARMSRRLPSRFREFARWWTRATRAFIAMTPSVVSTRFGQSASVAPPRISVRAARDELNLVVAFVCGARWITPSAMRLIFRKFSAVNCPRPSCWPRLWLENTAIFAGLKALRRTHSSARWTIFRRLMPLTRRGR